MQSLNLQPHSRRGVAQLSNLLFRRIPFGSVPAGSETQKFSNASGLEIRDTADWKCWKPALRPLSLGKTEALRRGRTSWAGWNCIRIFILVVAWFSAWPSALGFAHAQVGSVIENVEMPTLAESPHHLLTNATANVFIFFKPGQEHSRSALKELTAVEKELAGKSVHWVAIVSDRIPKADVEAAVKETGITMPVLIDIGDALYGKLGVALEPVAGITDQDHKLVAYQPFTKVNYAAVIRARIRYLLKEISDEELAVVLDPPAALNSSDATVAHRRLKLAEKLFEAKSYEKALESVNISIEKDASVAAAHALRGDILAAQGKFPKAIEAFERALKLDPNDARALQGMKSRKDKNP